MEKIPDVAGDRLAQREQAEVGGVGGLAFFERIDRRLPDVPWSDEVGLAHAERDDVIAALDEFEKVADPRAWDGGDIGGDFRGVIHGKARHSAGREFSGIPAMRQSRGWGLFRRGNSHSLFQEFPLAGRWADRGKDALRKQRHQEMDEYFSPQISGFQCVVIEHSPSSRHHLAIAALPQATW